MNIIWRELTEIYCQSIHWLSGSPPKSLQLTVKCRHPKWRLHFEHHRRPSLPSRVRASDWQHGTFMGIPHKVPFWLMAQPHAPPSHHSSVLIYSSSLCDLALALPTTSPVETPCGHIHYYLESRWAKASDRNTHAHTAPSHLTHTGPVLEGRWASHCLHSERISHPEGSAAWWARGVSGSVSGSVSLPSDELVWGMHEANPARAKTHTCTNTRAVCVNLAYFSCLSIYILWACRDLHKEINPSSEGINIHKYAFSIGSPTNTFCVHYSYSLFLVGWVFFAHYDETIKIFI